MKIFVYDYNVLGRFIAVFSLKDLLLMVHGRFTSLWYVFHIKIFDNFSKFPFAIFASNTQWQNDTVHS